MPNTTLSTQRYDPLKGLHKARTASPSPPKASSSTASERIQLTALDKADLVAGVDRLCWKMALKARNRWPHVGELEDFYQVALMGAMRAAEKFEVERGLKFTTYSTWWIRQFLNHFGHCDATIHIPQNAKEGPVALQAVLYEDGTGEAKEWDKPAPEEANLAEQHDHASYIAHRLLRFLNDRERFVIERRFGLDGFPSENLLEIGVHLECTRERVRQLQEKALAKLRKVAARSPLEAVAG